MALLRSAQRLLPGVWLGLLLAVALVGAPVAFALLPAPDAGRVAARMLAIEAQASLAFGVLWLLLERLAARSESTTRLPVSAARSPFAPCVVLCLAALFCTVAGYFVVQPMMVSARAGQGAFTFGQLHAASAVFYGVKVLLVLVLAWRGLSRSPSS